MGAKQTKNNFSFGSYQHGTRPGYHITKTNIYYAGRVLRNVVPTNFTKLRAGWAKTDGKLFYKGEILKGADPKSFRFLKNGYVVDNNVKKRFPKGVKSKIYRDLYKSK